MLEVTRVSTRKFIKMSHYCESNRLGIRDSVLNSADEARLALMLWRIKTTIKTTVINTTIVGAGALSI